jgi:hypothetical protein
MYAAGGMAVLSLGLSTLLAFTSDGNEIDFNTFRTDYLEKGKVRLSCTYPSCSCEGLVGLNAVCCVLCVAAQVREIVIVNGERARVTLENEIRPTLYFNIGDLHNFERKLEEAQRGLGLDPFDFVSVRYVREESVMYALPPCGSDLCHRSLLPRLSIRRRRRRTVAT